MSKNVIPFGKLPPKPSVEHGRIKPASARGWDYLNRPLPTNCKFPSEHTESYGQTDDGREVSFAKSVFRQFVPRFFCKSKGESDAAEREFVCQDDVQRLQMKLAAYRYSWTTADDITSSRKSVFPQALFGAMPSGDDDSPTEVRVIFVLDEVLPTEIDSESIMKKLGVPSGCELIQYAASEVYAMMEKEFAIPRLPRSHYCYVFESVEMPPLCTKMCATVYKQFGEITFPPMTLSEFGTFVHALQSYGQEVALATLQRIYSNRRQS